jgi:hypothetical protein
MKRLVAATAALALWAVATNRGASAAAPLNSEPHPQVGLAHDDGATAHGISSLPNKAAVKEVRDQVEAARERVQAKLRHTPRLTSWAESVSAEFSVRVSAWEQVTRPAMLAANRDLISLTNELRRWESLADWRVAFEHVRRRVQTDRAVGSDVVIGFATSMEKILPRGNPICLVSTNAVTLSLARNEHESFQVAVLPCEGPLHNVRVRATDLQLTDGTTFAATNIEAVPVGYVQTRSTPPYGSSCVGWWPDPILDFLPTAAIEKGDVQCFWVRVHAPKHQRMGTYRGQLEVLVGGTPRFAFDLSIRVFGFSVPDVSPLPLAITFSPEDSQLPETREQQQAWHKTEEYPVNAWRKHKLRWADFLADYYITYDSLYHRGIPDFEVLMRLRGQGRLGKFNLGYYDYPGVGADQLEAWKNRTLPRLHEGYTRAKQLGIIDHAYIYGCDEVKAEFFAQVASAAKTLRSEFPEVPVMTTTYDQSYGGDSVISAMNAFCPLTPSYDEGRAAAARSAGRQVWWYICCGPHHPHANMFIEYPAIEGRLLMGALTAKYRPDGFLYYQVSIWNSQKPIGSGPFTEWEPRSWTVYHGDGSWTCVGPDGTPLPTVRLENFRDGLEDYAYVEELRSVVAKVKASSGLRLAKAQWLERARQLIAVPETVVKSRTEFTLQPARLYAYRQALAEAIESAGVPPD